MEKLISACILLTAGFLPAATSYLQGSWHGLPQASEAPCLAHTTVINCGKMLTTRWDEEIRTRFKMTELHMSEYNSIHHNE
jgi:hypothetical protein